ncbi:MAG: hypothetical protein GF330_02695 [Candidatus Eisenbacteria bacterium]|nr:hypothetical protein [Candidatus Eisenbacteria bacterium]
MAAVLALLFVGGAAVAAFADLIAFTANQEFLSRIYLLRMDGSVERFYEYEFYRFVDTAVVDGELYVAEAFAPRVYRVDVATGDLEVIVDDWSLYYFYGLAWDGDYFYVDEWDLNRYTRDGTFDGRASFDETVYGSTFDGEYLWTLDDEHPLRCWDISQWPEITPRPENDFAPPSSDCRGLWFDGTHFWTAESGEAIGRIYQFAYGGEVVNQWWAPAYRGWSACVVPDPASTVGAPMARTDPGLRLQLRGNPARARLTVEFRLPVTDEVALELFGPGGQALATLASGGFAAGPHRIDCRSPRLPPGVYFLRLQTSSGSASRRVCLLP